MNIFILCSIIIFAIILWLNMYNTLIVSHLDELKSNCDDYININKETETSPSYVKY